MKTSFLLIFLTSSEVASFGASKPWVSQARLLARHVFETWARVTQADADQVIRSPPSHSPKFDSLESLLSVDKVFPSKDSEAFVEGDSGGASRRDDPALARGGGDPSPSSVDLKIKGQRFGVKSD